MFLSTLVKYKRNSVSINLTKCVEKVHCETIKSCGISSRKVVALVKAQDPALTLQLINVNLDAESVNLSSCQAVDLVFYVYQS